LVSPQQYNKHIFSISGGSIFTMPKVANAGFLGIGFNTRSAPFTITYIFPNLNGSIYKLKTGDQLLNMNDSSETDLNGYFKLLNKNWPGDTIRLQIKRSGTVLNESIILDTIPQRHFNHPAEMFPGGKSNRRDGFKQVFTHDGIIEPAGCGGPVFDFKGNFWGINIARYSRVSCLAIPANTIYRFIYNSLLLH